jgi:hypothetical protein
MSVLEKIASVDSTFSMYHELNMALVALCKGSLSVISVKKTECVAVSRRQLG